MIDNDQKKNWEQERCIGRGVLEIFESGTVRESFYVGVTESKCLGVADRTGCDMPLIGHGSVLLFLWLPYYNPRLKDIGLIHKSFLSFFYIGPQFL